MSETEKWQESNARQLGAAIAEVRQRLERYIQHQTENQPAPSPAPQQPTPTVPESASKRSFLKRLIGGQPARLALPLLGESQDTQATAESKTTAEPPSALA